MNNELELLLDKYNTEHVILILPKKTTTTDSINIIQQLEDNLTSSNISIIHKKTENNTVETLQIHNTSTTITAPDAATSDISIKKHLKTYIQSLKQIIKTIALKNKNANENDSNHNCSLDNNKNIISSLSHQIKTPINGITTGIQVLENYLTNDFFKTILKHLLSCCLELTVFVNDMLDFYLLKTKQISYNIKPSPIFNIIDEITAYFEGDFKDKNIRFKKHINPSIIDDIYTDKKRLKQILRYLISNSVRFTKNGYIYLYVNYLDDSRDCIEFTLIDNGIGIDHKQKDKVFMPFYQVDCDNNQWMTTQEGLGLGLTNSKFLVNQLGGDIYFVNAEDINNRKYPGMPLYSNGTALRFIIKNNKSDHCEDATTYIANNDITNTRDNNTILVIEDNRMNGELIKIMIKNILKTNKTNQDLDIQLMSDPKKVISLLKQYNYKILFLDLKMPEVSGFQILDMIDKNPILRERYNKKIVIITALANDSEVFKLQNYNSVLEIVFKPLDMEGIAVILGKIMT